MTLLEAASAPAVGAFRDMAGQALAAYGLQGAALRLLEEKKNVTWRVDAPGGERFLLRLCRPDGYTREEIASEAAWLLALRREEGLVVPEPVAGGDGSFVARCEAEGLEPRSCILFRWVEGETLDASISPAMMVRVGEVVARLHAFGGRFAAPAGFRRPVHDCDRMFGGSEVIPPGCREELVPRSSRELLDEAARRIRGEIEALGTGPEVFGMIHTDPEPDNMVSRNGEVFPIDFADCGRGYYLYDLAAALLPLGQKKDFPALREAFLRGYRSRRPLRPEHERLLDTFLIARGLFAVRWMLVHGWETPKVRAYAPQVVPHILGEVRRYLGEVEGDRGRESGGAARLSTVQLLSQLRARGAQVAADGDRLRLRAPKGALTPELQAELAERKAEVLAFLRRGATVSEEPPIPRAPRVPGQGMPLSFSQTQLWFLDQFDPGNPAYNIPQAVQLEGDVRLDLLETSLNEVVRRHEILRTTFGAAEGQPVQIVAPSLALRMPVVDLGAVPTAAREAEVVRLSREEARRPFDLSTGPLLRLTALRLARAEHRILVTTHHIVSDGWSGGVFVRELVTVYVAFAQGRPSPLPELPIQFGDYAAWQRSWLQGETLERQLAYWREKLAGAPAVLDLPTDRPRARYQTPRGGRLDVLLPGGLSDRLRSLTQRSGATLFMTLLAGFDALVFRYTGREDVVIGSPIANRNRTETEGLIGFFVNTLVLRTTFSGGDGFRGLLDRVKETTVDAFAHQDLTFEKLVEELRPERSLSHTPLFQVVFNFQNVPLPVLSLAGLTLSWVSAPTGTEKFDLNIAAREAPEGILLVLRYKRDLFDPTTIGRLAEHLRALLDAVAADPERPLAELPILGEAESSLLLREWNDTGVPIAPMEEGLFHERFARQAARTPEAPAVVFGGRSLSYGELDRQANRLAHRLRRLGAGRGSFVGICLERSVEMAIAIFGVLKSGAAYVPLDPEYPAERLAFLVRDAGVRVLVTQSKWLDLLPSEGPEGMTAVRLDADAASLEREDGSGTGVELGAGDLAYVIYTSGTTGEPKGAMIPHGAMTNYASALRAAIYGDRRTPMRVSLNARIAFDASVKQLSHLLWGDCLEIVPDAVRLDADALVAFAHERLDVLDCSPSQLKLLLKSGLSVDGTRPSVVLIGGEAIEESTWRELGACTGTRFYNHYGPTECTVNTTICRVAGDRPRLGRPVANVRIHLLDPALQPVAVGVPGEVCIGGAGLGRGYLGRPRQTAERFIPDPFGGEPGVRLYRSGDLARLLPTGEVEFLGRIDHQVKLRGFRIELGEIEAVLRSHPLVREAVVLLRDDSGNPEAAGPGERRLVAYVVPRSEEEPPAVPELRAFLRGKLPDYMVPAAFVVLDRLPLTANGKVDRRALPAPDRARAVALEAGETPRTATEERLAAIWGEVLGAGGADGVGREDNFFELGGHSLLATQVVSRVRESFRIDLPLRRLFESPTLAAFAEAVDASRGEIGLPPLARVPRSGDLPLSFAQQRLWFLNRLAPGSPAYNVPGIVRLSGPLRADLLERVLRELERRHETLRTTFDEAGGEPRQVIAAGERLGLQVVDLEALPEVRREPESRRLARIEARRPFDLERGPLVRACLLRLGSLEHIAVLSMHHIVSDAWSMGIFLRELAALHEAFRQGLPSPLPELPVQYADFAHWQRGWLAGEVLEAQLVYWRGQLAGLPEGLELPLDRPRPAVQTSRGGQRRLELSPELGRALAELGRREEATPFMTLLAGFVALLARLSGQDDVVAGSPIAGRNRREVEGIIGFFVNTLVLRADLAGAPGFRELVGRVRRTALDAYAHQDLPFERLVEELAPERRLDRSPLFQVAFTTQGTGRETLRLPGLTVAPLESESGTAKFDLTLVLLEQEHGGWAGVMEYNADLFDGDTVERMGGWLLRLLAGAVERPGAPVAHLPMMSGEELGQIVLAGGSPARLDGDTAIGLFERQAALRPGAPAVSAISAMSDSREALTYGELDRRASGLALRLRELGARPERVVALAARRSVDLVVATLAVAKTGAAYLPLDPSWPEARLREAVRDSGACLVLAEDGLLAPDALPISGLERDGSSGEPLPRRIVPESLAYVIYTSGSTGVPKGVQISHAALLSLVAWHLREHRVTADDRATLIASPAFDASVWELWPYLAAGASLTVVGDEDRLSPSSVLDRWVAERVTISFLPTPLAEAVLEQEPPLGLALRSLLVGGDRLRRAPGRPLSFALWNHYGPAEGTVVTTCGLVEPGDPRVPSIGKPVDGTRVWVADPRLEPVPAGVPGELVIADIGGGALARGYLGRPDLTAAAFLPDPLGGPGERLYRSGDLVRLRADGELEFLGRIDHQVKIRGVRIEMGEIETALAAHPLVREAVVLALGEERPRLAAFHVGEASGAELREHLRARLPEAMVPSLFVPVAELPLTSNGKVDRRALARLAPEREEHASSDPLGPTEEILAGIWCGVLGRERLGREDSFFDLGGHSLLAARVTSRVREAFGVELPLRALFESPTLAGLAHAVDEARRGGSVPAPPLRPMPREGELPLSFAQQRLWFLDRFEPGAWTYNIPLLVRIEGDLDPAALQAALRELVHRHESLRTVFVATEGKPVQVVRPAGDTPLPQVDLAHLAPEARQRELRLLSRLEARRPFDLAGDPMLRAALVRLGEREHALLLTVHHIASDGWSMEILWRELGELYGAARSGRPSPLPELPIQYPDFALWQRRWLSGEVLAAEVAHWRERLTGAPQVLELPTDRPRPAVQGRAGGVEQLRLDEELAEALRSLARRQGVTLFMTLLAAWQALLSRSTGQEDISIGTPVAGRSRLELEGLIGFFVNTLVLRCDLSGDPALGEALRQAREVVLDAHAHQDLPFEKLVEELKPERSLAHSPLFQVMFALQMPARESTDLSGLSLSQIGVEAETAQFDWKLTMTEAPGRLVAALQYNADLFDATTANRALRHYEKLLRELLHRPRTRLSEAVLLSPEERQQLLVEWQDTAARRPRTTLHRLFEEQADRTPEAVAVADERGSLTYRELDHRANQVARHLRRLGVEPDAPVGICMERSVELSVGLLGILKAGGAYLPVDPGYPPARIAYMLQDSAVPVLLTQQRLLAGPGLSSLHGQAAAPTVVRIDADWEEIADQRTDRPDGGARSESLAYVIYTSGSTGRPKGAMIPHSGIVNRLLWMQEAYGLTEADRILQKTPFSFDVSVWELFWPLLTGARLVMARPEGHKDTGYLRQVISGEGITILHFVPSMLQSFVEEPEIEGCTSLRCVICSGEALPLSLQERFFARLPGVQLENLYGPTEASVDVTSWRCEASGERHQVPIGRPISNSSIHVLDARLGPVPIGVAGELFIGGAGLARGYLGRPDLTAERFVPDPFRGEPGARLYRTGDLVRLLADGNVDFLGRVDHQVKIRGFRIELGEIEAALLACPEVREAVVVSRRGAAVEARLAAYVVPAGNREVAAAALRDAVRERLPEHMVPADFVLLPALPLNPSGKVDRRALPDPEARETDGHLPARDELELEIARIWEELLGRPVGVRDDFFELGGHSLLAVQLLARIRSRFGQRIALPELFRGATVERLAARLREGGARPERSTLVELRPGADGAPLFLVHPIGGNVLCYLELARHLGGPVYGLQAAAAGESLEAMAARYVESVRGVQPAGPYRLAGWSLGGAVAFEMARRLEETGERVDLLALIDPSVPPAAPGREPDAEALARLFARDVEGLRGLPPELDEEETRELLDVFGSNIQALRAWQPRPHAGRALLFRAAERLPGETSDPVAAWSGLVTGGLDVEEAEGHHYSILSGARARALAERLRERLGRADS